MYKKITLFIPSQIFGGLEILYIRCARELFGRGYDLEIIDYDDGIVVTALRNENITFKFTRYKFDQGIISLSLKGINIETKIVSNDSVVLMSLKYLPYINTFFEGNSKLLFWDEHPNNLIGYIGSSWLINKFYNIPYKLLLYTKNLIKYKRLKKLFNTVIAHNGIYFMCRSNYLANVHVFKTRFAPKFIPIPISSKTPRINKTPSYNSNYLNISYIGRMDLDKYILVKELIEDIEKINRQSETKLTLHIIGSGTHFDDIKHHLQEKKLEDHIHLKGNLYGDDLDKFISTDIDIAFAVGTSALETAILGVPTVFMRGTNTSKRLANKYLWVFDAEDYELSLTENFVLRKKAKVKSIIEIVSDVVKNNKSTSSRCRDYAYNNHSIDFTMNRLMHAIKQTELKLSDLR